MLSLDYASDSEDDTTTVEQSAISKSAGQTTDTPTITKSPGRNGSSLGLALPPPKAKKAIAPKKIVVELPKLDKRGSDDDDGLLDEIPAAKKPKLGGKGGASALLSMLPAPKKSTLEIPAPKRVLGGGNPRVAYSSSVKTESVAERPAFLTETNVVEKEAQSEVQPMRIRLPA